jgi:hypothetical protein
MDDELIKELEQRIRQLENHERITGIILAILIGALVYICISS